MDRNTVIMAVLIVLIMMSAIVLDNTGNNETYIQLAKTGLEQCPQDGPLQLTKKTIWVKDCSEYLKSIK